MNEVTDYLLVAGIATDDNGKGVRVALVEPGAVEFPATEQLHHCRTLRSFERFWERRIVRERDGLPRPIVGVGRMNNPGLLLWLEERNSRIIWLEGYNLLPFLRESANVEIPGAYRHAHALAVCAAYKQTAPGLLSQLAGSLTEFNYHLREMEETLWRLAAACEVGARVRPFRPTVFESTNSERSMTK